MPSLSSDTDGKSEATLLVMGLADAIMWAVETVQEAMRIPLGAQEVRLDGFRKWWRGADPQLRTQFIQENGGGLVGVQKVMELLGPSVTGLER